MNLLSASASGLSTYRVLIGICVLYLAVSCLYLSLPGLQYDELLFAGAALGRFDDSPMAYGWSAWNRHIPVMLMTYIGPVKALLYAPIFALLPPSPIVVRLPIIIIGLITIVVTYALAVRAFNRQTALIAALLLATDPSYIIHVRLDWGPVALMMFFKMTALYCFARFATEHRLGFLAAGSLALGLGLYDKANFGWVLIALPIATVIVWPKEVWQRLTWRNFKTATFFGLLGCWPLVFYNIATWGGTFQGQLGPPGHVAEYFNFKTLLLKQTLDGSAPYVHLNNGQVLDSFFSLIDAPENLNPLVFTTLQALDFRGTLTPVVAVGAIFVGAVALRSKESDGKRALIFFALLFVLIQVQIYLTYNAGGSYHIMMLYPFHQILIAYAASYLLTVNRRFVRNSLLLQSALRYAVVSIVALLLISNFVIYAKYLQTFVITGGRGGWSSAIYDLAEYAQTHKEEKYILMDWGFNTQLSFLSRGQIDKLEVFWLLLDVTQKESQSDQLFQRVATDAAASTATFVFHTPRYTQFAAPRDVFDVMVKKHDLQVETVKTFFQKNGEPVFVLQKVGRRLPSTAASE